MKNIIKSTIAILATGTIGAISANAATTLVSDTFEGSLGNWTIVSGVASLYEYGGAPDTNYATTGTGALLISAQNNKGMAILTNNLSLATNQATSVTISLDHKWNAATGSRFMWIDWTNDGGTTWSNLDTQNAGWSGKLLSNTTGTFFTKTLTEADVGGAFTDGVNFRLRGKPADNGGFDAHIDNLVISGENVVIPEPSAVLLGGLGGLLLLRRRR